MYVILFSLVVRAEKIKVGYIKHFFLFSFLLCWGCVDHLYVDY